MEEQKTCEEILQSAMPDTTDDFDDVLQHWGIKGQKWGVRRYQNKDGSLTPQGRKRYGSLEEAVGALNAARIKAKRKKQLKKARAAAAEKRKADEEAKVKAEQRKKDVDDGKVSARDMTADELQRRIDKLNLEKRYKQLLNETNPSAETISAGKQFAKKMWNDAVQPAVANATKEIVGNYLKDVAKRQFGIKESDIDILKKEHDKWDYKKKISDAKKTIYENDRKMNGEYDDKSISVDDRIKIKNNPDILTEAEKDKYEKQGWYKRS